MKKTFCLLALCMSFSAVAGVNNSTILQKSLKPWQPLAISEKNNIVTVNLDAGEITNEAYLAVTRLGICVPAWDKKNASYLKDTKEVRILNKHNFTGFVLENPRSTCNEVGAAVGDEAVNSIILSNTHMNMNH